MERKFLLGTFRVEKQDYLSRCSFAPRNVALQRPEKPCFSYFWTGYEDSQETGSKFVPQTSPTMQFDTTQQRGEVWRQVRGSLSNDYGDSNENGKKQWVSYLSEV